MMNDKNKVIAKNTVYMYLRMVFSMLVGLYTSRVILKILGVEDYGLYNVIGGIVAIFSVLNYALVNTTSRFITVSLAKGNILETRPIFNMSFLIHLVVGLLIVALGETIGLWYLHNKLVIPEGREMAAGCLYQFTVISAFLSTLIVPYNATIIAHEHINVYAIIQIIVVFLKLGIVLILQYVAYDKLIAYALLILLVTILEAIVNFIYCRTHFIEVKFLFYWSKDVFTKILKFVGWAMFGNFSNMFYTQGINLMLNAFCGPAVNAARGIAIQVQSVATQLAYNVQTAINPQIIKSYSTNNIERLHMLICASSRICYYLLLFFIIPMFLEADFILHIWLGIVPDHTVNFIRLTLVTILLDAFINPMYTANLATGKLNMYYIPVSICSIAFMFITYFSIKLTHIPEIVFICYIGMMVIGFIIRIFVMNKQVQLKTGVYIKRVLFPALIVTALSSVFPIILHVFIQGDVVRLLGTTVLSIVSVCLVSFSVGITKSERQLAIQFVKTKIKRK